VTAPRQPIGEPTRELSRSWQAGRPVDLAAALGPLSRGPGDPTMRLGPSSLWWVTRTEAGPATLWLVVGSSRYDVAATAWGPGADRVLDGLPALLGADDDPSGFVPHHPVVREAWRRHPGWRVPRTGRVLESLVPAVLEQKVTGREAARAWRTLVRAYGEPAPGPAGHATDGPAPGPAGFPVGLRVPPAPEVWRRVPSWVWHRAGVDLSRSRTIVTAAGSAGRLEQLTGVAHDEAARRMRSLPGIGAWTAAEVAQRALGDADAVSVGDFHLSSLVGTALVGERVDDDAMLELLEPYRGHRYRAIRMIELAGVSVERHGPRFSGRDYRAM
jgi:3-methyladenine DNA glycosylase/8-oxoguanine DNA glycosylase